MTGARMTGARSTALPATRGLGRGALRGAPPQTGDAATRRTPARQKATALNRDRHQADWSILVIVVMQLTQRC